MNKQDTEWNATPDIGPTFEALLDYIKQSHGFDFTSYKRSSLMRRLQRRMQALKIFIYSDYEEYLKINPEEFTFLFNSIEVNFTDFFRDTLAWQYLATEIVSQIIQGKTESEPIRIWSAGCASGEETYTLVIMLAQALGRERFRARVRIYGTDVDKDALDQARQATYHASQITGIPSRLLNQYFEQAEDKYIFCKDLRRSIIFGHHNILENAPMSQIDLLVCRNVLIYFNLESQTRALIRFHFGLKDSGFLFLGNSEMIPTEITNLFSSVNIQHRIFTKLPRFNLNSRLLVKALRG